MSKLMHESITKEILGAAFSVHTFLGNGFPEVIYQRALYHELQDRELLFGREVSMPIFYKNLPKPIGYRRADFVVEDKVIVELKARKALEDTHMSPPAKAISTTSSCRTQPGAGWQKPCGR